MTIASLDPDYKLLISPYRKLLVTLSDKLSQVRDLQRMKHFLEDAGYELFQDSPMDDPLEIFLAMEHARLMSSKDLSFLREMMSSFHREDLVKIIDEFNESRGIRKG